MQANHLVISLISFVIAFDYVFRIKTRKYRLQVLQFYILLYKHIRRIIGI